ncbi:MAG: SEC-C domain-containing protein [Kordiimonadaceae bacterium]|nr:SEC-C domain-containing protein [Kordiimonadaceae bacterium]
MIVPKNITVDIKHLISKIGLLETPIYIPCWPEEGAVQKDCFPVVARKVHKDGGKCVYGWQIWQTSILVEAEFHAVWESPDGQLIDITPKPGPLTEILFLPDPVNIYEGKQVNNVRLNVTDNSLVDEFIAIHDAVFRIENKGIRAQQHELSITGREAIAHQVLSSAKPMLEYMASNGLSRKSPCPCDSGKKYKVCHGKKNARLINEY